jgi:putative membrane protein
MNWNTLMNWNALLNSVVYSLVGIVVFCVGFIVVDKMTKYDLWDELINKKNMALAVVIGFVSLGISIIIAAAIHG